MRIQLSRGPRKAPPPPPGALHVEVSQAGALLGEGPRATVRVQVQSATLCDAIERAIAGALTSELMTAPLARRVVYLRTLTKAQRCDAEGALAVVRVTHENRRRLGRIVEVLEARGCAGVQLVWSGAEPPAHEAEQPIFTLLEARRGKRGIPVLLAPTTDLLELLTRLASTQEGDR